MTTREPIEVVREALSAVRKQQASIRELIEAPAYCGRTPLIEALKALGAVEASLLKALPK